jgi:hypothetical protein
MLVATARTSRGPIELMDGENIEKSPPREIENVSGMAIREPPGLAKLTRGSRSPGEACHAPPEMSGMADAPGVREVLLALAVLPRRFVVRPLVDSGRGLQGLMWLIIPVGTRCGSKFVDGHPIFLK